MDLKQFDNMLHDTEVKLKRLKSLYEQWFQGIERLEPTVPRKDLDRTFKVLQKEKPRNTAARFKLNTLQSRYNTYTAHWQRIARKIEEGTYERDLRRVRRKRERTNRREEKEPVKTFEVDLEQEFDPDTLFAQDEISDVLTALDSGSRAIPQATPSRGLSAFSAVSSGKAADSIPPDLPGEDTAPNAINPFVRAPATATFGRPRSERPPAPARPSQPVRPPTPAHGAKRPVPPPPPSSARKKAPPPPPPAKSRRPAPRAGGDPMRKLYDEFASARRQHNQGERGYDTLAARVQKMRSKLVKKHAGKKIDFEVVVKDGKVGLKPKIR